MDRVVVIDRSIPAWAGKPEWRSASPSSLSVHPRVGGETRVHLIQSKTMEGPSPRGRGNLACSVPAPGEKGSIPAWAGKPSTQTAPKR